MKPEIAIVVTTAIQENIVLTAVAMEITIQENLPFFKKSLDHVPGMPDAWERLLQNGFIMPVQVPSSQRTPVIPHDHAIWI